MAAVMATDSGTVVEVYTTTLGDELAAAASAGATTLSVKDAVDFDDAGGWLTIGTETIYYTTAVDDEDNDVGILTLSTPLANAYAEGERVILDPPSFEKFALVMVGDFGEAVEAVVPHTLWDRIGDGIRPDGEGEVVILSLVGSTFEVTDVVGSEPVIDGSYLDPDVPLDPAIVPAPPPPAPVAPTSSPMPEVIGGIGILLVRWAPVTTGTSPIDVEVHLSTTTPVAGDATTLAATAQGTQATLRTLPDGTPLSYVDANGDPVVYHVALRAKNAAGSATLSAEDSGSMVQITGPDIAVDAAWVGTFTWDKATGGTMDAEMVVGGNIYAQGAAGERVSLSSSGFTVTGPTADGNPIYVNFPTDGAKPNIFSGTVEANTVEVVNGATFRSNANMVASQATLNVSSGIQAPQSPPATDITWPQVNVDTTTKRNAALGNFALDPADCYGLAWDGTRWLTVQNTSGGYRVWGISTAGATSVQQDVAFGFGSSHIEGYGVTSIGGVTYVLDTYAGDWQLHNLATDGAALYTRINTTKQPTMGTDGTNLLVAESVPSSAEVRVRVYSTDNLGQIDETITTSGLDFGATQTPAGIARGTFDYGATRIITNWRGSTSHDFMTANSTGVVQANESWPRGNISPRGFAWDGANFWALTAGGVLQKYTTLKWTTEPDRWQAAYTWRDTNSLGTGTHETNLGTRATFTMKKRAQLKVTTTAIPTGTDPDDPNNVSVYLGRAASGDATMIRQNTSTSPTLTTFAPVFTADGTHPVAPASNNFPSTTPGKIAATLGGFSIDGNSNGSVGTGTFRTSVDARADARIAATVQPAAAGEVSITTGAVGSITTQAITFPAGRFATVPVVTTNVSTTRPDLHASSARNITTSGCDILVYRNAASTTVAVEWIARAAG